MKFNLNNSTNFEDRHIGSEDEAIHDMLKFIKTESIEDLINETIPEAIRVKKPLAIPAIENEYEFLKAFKELASKNKVYKSYIGLGYYNCVTPTVIQRNILEN